MTDQAQQTPAAAPPTSINLLDHITVAAFDSLARRYGYVSRIDVDAQWTKAMAEVMQQKAENANDPNQAVAEAQETIDAVKDYREARARRPGPKPKAEKPVEQVNEPNPPAHKPPPAHVPPAKTTTIEPATEVKNDTPATMTDAREALQALVKVGGVGTGMKVLQEFGAKKISEVPADKLGEFIASCEATLVPGNAPAGKKAA